MNKQISVDKLIKTLIQEMDIDIAIIGKEANAFDGEQLDLENNFNKILKKLSLLFDKLKRKIGQETFIVPLETKGLTPLLRGFFSQLNKKIVLLWSEQDEIVTSKEEKKQLNIQSQDQMNPLLNNKYYLKLKDLQQSQNQINVKVDQNQIDEQIKQNRINQAKQEDDSNENESRENKQDFSEANDQIQRQQISESNDHSLSTFFSQKKVRSIKKMSESKEKQENSPPQTLAQLLHKFHSLNYTSEEKKDKQKKVRILTDSQNSAKKKYFKLQKMTGQQQCEQRISIQKSDKQTEKIQMGNNRNALQQLINSFHLQKPIDNKYKQGHSDKCIEKDLEFDEFMKQMVKQLQYIQFDFNEFAQSIKNQEEKTAQYNSDIFKQFFEVETVQQVDCSMFEKELQKRTFNLRELKEHLYHLFIREINIKFKNVDDKQYHWFEVMMNEVERLKLKISNQCVRDFLNLSQDRIRK